MHLAEEARQYLADEDIRHNVIEFRSASDSEEDEDDEELEEAA